MVVQSAHVQCVRRGCEQLTFQTNGLRLDNFIPGVAMWKERKADLGSVGAVQVVRNVDNLL